MALRDIGLQSAYRSGRDSLIDQFYVPCLQEAVLYDRAVGYFSSTLYQVVGLAFSDFVRRGGKMRLICSPALTPDDFMAMKGAAQFQDFAQLSVRQDLEAMLANPQTLSATRLLATLISAGVLDVRIAFPDSPQGLFHDKLGIFADEDGKRVSFNGSANETWRAWGLNHESFDVFCSWNNEFELLRTRDHADMFRQLWVGNEPGVNIAALEQVTIDQLISISHEDVDFAIEQVRTYVDLNRAPVAARPLMEHQRMVLEAWEDNGHRGIVNFATGAGKTLTAIEAVKRWTAQGGAAVVMVPGRDLHDQWANEIELEMPAVQILPAGAGHRRADWMRLLPIYSASGEPGGQQRVILTTNQTFVSSDFQRRLKVGEHLLLVVDEMHRAGSQSVLPVLESTSAGGVLGLSATYRRQFDAEGTDRLTAYFGGVLNPVIGLAEALMLGLLVPYDYRLHEVSLNDDEQAKYDDLTRRIGQMIGRGDSPNQLGGPLQMLLIKRARILKQARQKVPAAIDVLAAEYSEGDRWLVYCDDLQQLRQMVDAALAIDLPALEFHSEMKSDRSAVIRSLRDHGGVVVAIRCLDEGIDIPVTDHALILASSTVEREYIQRRGRVLRRDVASGKVSAEVHDLLLVDHSGGALTKGEASRALEFARLARNPAARERLKVLVALSRDPIDLPDSLGDEDDQLLGVANE